MKKYIMILLGLLIYSSTSMSVELAGLLKKSAYGLAFMHGLNYAKKINVREGGILSGTGLALAGACGIFNYFTGISKILSESSCDSKPVAKDCNKKKQDLDNMLMELFKSEDGGKRNKFDPEASSKNSNNQCEKKGVLPFLGSNLGNIFLIIFGSALSQYSYNNL